MIRPTLMLAAIALGGCATTTEPRVETVVVNVPVAVPCVPQGLPEAPKYPDTAEALRRAPDAAARVGLIVAGRALRDQRLAEVEPVIAGCR